MHCAFWQSIPFGCSTVRSLEAKEISIVSPEHHWGYKGAKRSTVIFHLFALSLFLSPQVSRKVDQYHCPRSLKSPSAIP